MDRRDFLRCSASGLMAFGCNDVAAFAREAKLLENVKDKYSIVILGDTHYDASPDTIYHEGYTDPNPVREAHHRSEFARNADMWSDRIPRLLKRASMLVDDTTTMVLQTGDLIQGDTAGALNHKRMLADAMDKVKAYMGSLPLVTVMGNHDMRGANDEVSIQAYKEYMTERMGKELGIRVPDVNFSFNVGPDAFLVIDFNHPDIKVLEKLLKDTEGARYTFLLIHGPVIPFDSLVYSTWYYLGSPSLTEKRRYARQLLAKRNAIVLCGHTHTTEFAEWKGDGGTITQMTMHSVWSAEERGVYKIIYDGADKYGATRFARAAQRGLSDDDKYVVQLNEYKQGITRYLYSDTAGSYRLNVSKKKVTIDFYAGDSIMRTAQFLLR